MTKPTAEQAFIAGHPCLDFANTLSGRLHAVPVDHLRDYTGLLEWGRRAGLLTESATERIARAGKAKPAAAEDVFARAIRLREDLYRVISALAAGNPPETTSLGVVNEELTAAKVHYRLTPVGRVLRARPEDPLALEVPIWAVVRSAADLLTSPSFSRVRECGAETCSWLFLDATRNRSRRWCDAKVCGNRERVRRHYWRVRGAGVVS